MSDKRNVWFVRTRWTGQSYPVTWEGWLVAATYAAFILLIASWVASAKPPGFTVASALVVLVVTINFFVLVFRHADMSQTVSEFRKKKNA